MSLLIKALRGEKTRPVPVWMMRQAGRYLPEYRELRKQAGSFLDLCYSPELACEVTLQPIRRYGFDAAILFADILLIPDGLGQNVRFDEGIGPVLEPIVPGTDLGFLSHDDALEHLQPVFETVRLVRSKLDDQTALIGFCGAPWTVATYMIAGRGTPDQKPARLAAYRNPKWFEALIDILVESSIEYLSGQVEAGCGVIQIFDSWSGVLTEAEFEKWCIAPVKKIVAGVKARHRDVPIIGFPRGAGVMCQSFVSQSGVDGLSLDGNIPLQWAAENLQGQVALQGNLDPLLVVAGGAALDREVDRILEVLGAGAFVFNLSHGLIPETPPEHVGQVVDCIRRHSAV